jgi:hypothetical protein
MGLFSPVKSGGNATVLQGPMHTGFGVRGNADVSRANSITRVKFITLYPLPPMHTKGVSADVAITRAG